MRCASMANLSIIWSGLLEAGSVMHIQLLIATSFCLRFEWLGALGTWIYGKQGTILDRFKHERSLRLVVISAGLWNVETGMSWTFEILNGHPAFEKKKKTLILTLHNWSSSHCGMRSILEPLKISFNCFLYPKQSCLILRFEEISDGASRNSFHLACSFDRADDRNMT